MYNLEGLVKPEALTKCRRRNAARCMNTLSFTHTREHNIYFMKAIPGLPEDHPALATHQDHQSHGLRRPDHPERGRCTFTSGHP